MTDKSRKAVPREATEAMLAAALRAEKEYGDDSGLPYGSAWRVMFDAAPVPDITRDQATYDALVRDAMLWRTAAPVPAREWACSACDSPAECAAERLCIRENISSSRLPSTSGG